MPLSLKASKAPNNQGTSGPSDPWEGRYVGGGTPSAAYVLFVRSIHACTQCTLYVHNMDGDGTHVDWQLQGRQTPDSIPNPNRAILSFQNPSSQPHIAASTRTLPSIELWTGGILWKHCIQYIQRRAIYTGIHGRAL